MKDLRSTDDICKDTNSAICELEAEVNTLKDMVDSNSMPEGEIIKTTCEKIKSHNNILQQHRHLVQEQINKYTDEIKELRSSQSRLSKGSPALAGLNSAEGTLELQVHNLNNLIDKIDAVHMRSKQFLANIQTAFLSNNCKQTEIKELESLSEFTRNIIAILDRERQDDTKDVKSEQLAVELPEYWKQMVKNGSEPVGGNYYIRNSTKQ